MTELCTSSYMPRRCPLCDRNTFPCDCQRMSHGAWCGSPYHCIAMPLNCSFIVSMRPALHYKRRAAPHPNSFSYHIHAYLESLNFAPKHFDGPHGEPTKPLQLGIALR